MEILDNCLNDHCYHSVQQRFCVLTTIFVNFVPYRCEKFIGWFRCLMRDTLFERTSNLNKHLPICDEFVENINPETVNQLRETFLDELRAFKFEVTEGLIFFNNVVVFDFDSYCLKTSRLIETKTTALELATLTNFSTDDLQSARQTIFCL